MVAPNTYDRWNVFADATAAVEGQISTLGTIASNSYTSADDAMSALTDIADALEALSIAITVTPEDFDDFPDVAEEVTDMDETKFIVTTPTAPSTVDVTDITPALSAAPSSPTLQTLAAPSSPTLAAQTLTTSEITGGNETYVDSLLTAMKSWLLNQIKTGAVGITTEVEDAIFKREYERSILIEKDLEDGIAAEWSSKGWPLPNGALVAAINQAKINFANKRLDVSRDVAIKSFELALSNIHFIIQQTISIEAHLIAWANWVAERAFQVSRAIVVDKEISSYRARNEPDLTKIKKFDSDISLYNARNETDLIKIKKFDSDISLYNARNEPDLTKIKKFDSDISLYNAERRANIDDAKTRIENDLKKIRKFEADINLYSSQMRVEGERIDAVAKGYNAIDSYKIQRYALNLNVIKTRINQAVADTELLIKDKDIEIKQYESINALMIQAQDAIGKIGASLLHGALGSVHVSAAIHAADSANYGYKAPASLTELIEGT